MKIQSNGHLNVVNEYCVQHVFMCVNAYRPLRYFTLRYSELAFCPSRGSFNMTLV